MAKTWILDTETKGTGAHIAPLPRAKHAPERERALDTVTLRRPEQPYEQPEPAGAPAFRIVDVLAARVVAERVNARDAVAALAGMRSVHDARVYVWVPVSRRWRLLTLAEQRLLWEMRAASPARPMASAGA